MSEESSKSVSQGLYPISLALISVALFGAATPASKALLGDLSAFQLAGLLYLGAAAGILTVVIRQKKWLAPWRMNRRNQWLLLGAVSCSGIFGPVLLLFGLRLASAASVSMWLNLEMVATAVLGRILFNDYLGRFGWLGVSGIVFSGALLGIGEGPAGPWAGLLMAAACICWGFDNHFTALIDGITPSQCTFWKGLVAGIVNLIIGVWLHEYDASAIVTAGALSVGVLSYGVSISLYIVSAQNMGATRAQMYFASGPFLGVALSALILGESISAIQLIAASLLAASLGVLQFDQHEHEHIHEYMAHEHSHRHDDGHHNHQHPGLPSSHRHTHWHEQRSYDALAPSLARFTPPSSARLKSIISS